jgi:hypothetical protein
MKFLVNFLLLLCNLFFLELNAQNILSKNDASGIIDLLNDELHKNYLYPNKVDMIESRLLTMKNSWTTDSIAASVFSQEVNSIMMGETGDQHLKFYFDMEKFNMFKSSNEELIDSLEKAQFRKVNFGVQKFEILTGNIAYLKLNKFQQLEDVKHVLLGAINMMSNADAIVLDLRNNGGGDGRTKEFLYSFFLNEQQWNARLNQEFFSWNEIVEIKKDISQASRLENVPLCVLTGNGTFSAAEGFCYDLQSTKRARIIGVKTKGGGHSGSSVALDKGFLVFIPTGGQESPIEGKGITPDFPTSESLAFWKAQELTIADLMRACQDLECEQNMKWAHETAASMLKNNEGDWKIEKKHLGAYSRGFTIGQQGKEYVIEHSKMGISSVLVPIEENYWLARDLEDFGFGNYRIRFLEDGKARLYVNMGVKVAEVEIGKE